MLPASLSIRQTIVRTLLLWLLSNVGGTLLLGVGFALTHRLNDSTIALAGGLLAALVTLPLVLLAVPFFAVLTRFCAECSRRSMALMGVVLFFLLANQLLLLLLPFTSLRGLLEMSLPYLAAGLLTVFWLYSPRGIASTGAKWTKANSANIQLSE